eukprot:UN01624
MQKIDYHKNHNQKKMNNMFDDFYPDIVKLDHDMHFLNIDIHPTTHNNNYLNLPLFR